MMREGNCEQRPMALVAHLALFKIL
jgi:hypothetical protein